MVCYRAQYFTIKVSDFIEKGTYRFERMNGEEPYSLFGPSSPMNDAFFSYFLYLYSDRFGFRM